MRASFRRGVGAVSGAALAVAVMIAVAIYAYSNMRKPPTTTPDPILRSLDSYMSQKIVIGPTASGHYVVNTGTSPVSIEYLVLYDNALRSVAMVKPERGLTCSVTEAVLPPGGISMVECSRDLTLLAIVSSEGKVFVRDPRLAAPYLIPRAVPQRALLTPEIVSSLEQYIESAEQIRINTSTALTKLFDHIAPVSVDIELNASLVVALKAPSSTEAWNILITGYGAYGRRSYSWLKVGVGSPINLSKIGAFRFRIKIENLSINDGGKILVNGSGVSTPRIVPCLVNSGKQCWVSISGVAGKISVYVNGTSPSTNVDLYPYYITGDLDENGYPEFFFVSQDFGVGDSSHANDLVNITIRTTTTRVYANDATVRPIRIVFTGAPINNSKYATAVVSMRLVFWDSSLDDISDNDNRVLLRVGLYDPATRNYVYSVSLSYFELSRYRTVKPVTISYVIKDFLLYIPSVEEIGRRELLIAVDILDPYDRQGTRNDAEIFLGIEYLGLVLGVRI